MGAFICVPILVFLGALAANFQRSAPNIFRTMSLDAPTGSLRNAFSCSPILGE